MLEKLIMRFSRFSLSLLVLFCFSCSAHAEEMYLISPTELTLLETNLSKLESINKMQQEELKLQKSMLAQAKFDLEELQVALSESKQELTKAQDSLASANLLLEKFAKEEKSRLRKIKRQRNLAYALTGGLAYYIFKDMFKEATR